MIDKKTILIQQASGNLHEKLLELTRPIHKQYCAKFGFEYWSVFGHLLNDRSPHWNKIGLIQAAMERGADFVIWLDADCLIVDQTANLLDGMPIDGDIGMVVHRIEPQHFNSGAIYMKRTWMSWQFIKAVWNAYDPLNLFPWRDQAHWNDQSVIMRLNDSTSTIKEIDDRWNATSGINESPNPVVVSFHGSERDKRISMMETAIQTHCVL